MSVGGCLCALRARDVGMWILKNIHLYWIYTANNWGICDIWRVSVRPSGRWVGEHVSVEYIYIYLYWIYSANNWGIYDSWRVSVRPSGAGSGKLWIVDHVLVG